MYFNWDANSKNLFGTYLHRGFKALDILEINAESNGIRTIYSESSPTHINNTNILRKLKNGQFILGTEKSGWNQLYLMDWKSGALINRITLGDYVVKNLLNIDEKNEIIYFEAAGKKKTKTLIFLPFPSKI